MNILGFEITRNTKQDQTFVRSVAPTTTPISQIPSIPSKTLSYDQSYTYGRGMFQGGEYDMSEIGKIEDTDSYVRKAFQKKLGLMFKEGSGYSGANPDTIRYVKTRMAQIAKASDIPTLDLMKRIAASLIRTSNAYLVKARDPKASGGAKRKDANGKALKPVAAYFPAAPETMRYEIDSVTGKITKWRQMLPSGLYKEFPIEDVIHFAIHRREGFHLGVPDLVPVIDDIRALRQIEENIELLVYQYLFPLFHYKVGTETAPAGYTEDGKKETDVVLEQIQYMPSEGAIVTPERHEINAIGAEGRALRAEGYLTHFKKRVFSGLGVSDVDMGESDTSNRATALTLSRQLVDTVKEIQDSLEYQWDQKVISELLLESTFGINVLEEENMVHLKFHEIDINSKIEIAKHNIDLFKANAITHDEYRAQLGYEPLYIPESSDDQDPKKYPEWFRTYWKLFDEPTQLIRAVDEPYSAAAKAMAESRSISMTAKQTGEATKEKVAAEKAVQPPPAPKANKDFTDSYLKELFTDFESDSINRVISSMSSRRVVDRDWLTSSGFTWVAMAMDKIRGPAFNQMVAGFNAQTGRRSAEAVTLLTSSRSVIENRIEHYLSRLVSNAVAMIVERVGSLLEEVDAPNLQSSIRKAVGLIFDSMRYRSDYIWDVEFRKAYNYGRLLGARFLGQSGFTFVAGPDACEECRAANGRFISAESTSIDELPPLHPNSRMTIMTQDRLGFVPQREPGEPMVEQDDPALQKTVKKCPDCGLTCTKQKRSGNYYCTKCGKAVEPTEEETEDSTKLERCIKQVKSQLRKKYPGKSTKTITSSAWAICRSSLKE